LKVFAITEDLALRRIVGLSLTLVAAALLFASITMGWFRVRTRWWETILLGVAVFTLFRPDFFMDQLYDEYRSEPAAKVFEIAGRLPDDERLVMLIGGTRLEGNDVRKTVAVQLGDQGPVPVDAAAAVALGRKRIVEAGLSVNTLGGAVQVTNVKFGSRARKSGFEQGFEIFAVQVPTDRPTPHWFYLPALLLIVIVWISQGQRLATTEPAGRPAPARA